MPGQGQLGSSCAWCELPATSAVEVQPDVYGKEKGVDVLKQRAIVVPCCDTHAHIKDDQPPPMTTFRRRKAKGVEQLDLLDAPAGGPRNAIFKDMS